MLSNLTKQNSKWSVYWPFAVVLINFAPIYTHVTSESTMGLLGLLLIPFICQQSAPTVKTSLYTFLSLGTVALYFVIPSPMVAFTGVWLGVFALFELRIGKLNPMAFFIPIFFSRIIRHLMSIFAFPLRITLTELASKTFALFGINIQSHGSEIVYQNQSFFVDTACVGLNLVSTSFILLFFILALKERKLKTHHSTAQVLLFIGFNFGLILCSNYLRIVALIVFKSPPETVSHDVIGILSLVLFNILPIYFISNKISPKLVSVPSSFNKSTTKLIIGLIPFVLLCALWYNKPISASNEPINSLKDWHKIINNVYEQKNGDITSYVKKQNPLSITNHNPLICWRGSGYQIHSEEITEVSFGKVYVATLQKGDEFLKTAWWYASKNGNTLNEVKWRKEMLLNQTDYYLINVTAPTKDQLINHLCLQMNELKL